MAITTAQVAFWLGVYSTVVATAVALLTLYGEIFQRVKVGANEDFLVNYQGGRKIVMSPEAVAEDEQLQAAPAGALRPILTIRVRNRGRQAVQVRTVSKAEWFKVKRWVFDEPIQSLPAVVEPGRYLDFHTGVQHDYEHGSLGRISRFYVVDGADRIHPLRERWLQRVENVFYRRMVIRIRRRRRTRAR